MERMAEAMASDCVPLGDHPLQQFRVTCSICAEHEEGRMGAMGPQRVQYSWSNVWGRPVVYRQGQQLFSESAGPLVDDFGTVS
jgi:hypothetical protein